MIVCTQGLSHYMVSGWMLVFLTELNGLQTWSTDIGNAYLEAGMKEKVFFVTGPEFGDLTGHTLIIVKVLYRLWTNSAHWHDRFAED
jgi:hypothetical protein